MARDIAALVILNAASFWFARQSAEFRSAPSPLGRPTRAAVGVLIVYALAFSLLSVDLLMSVEPGWTSTLFPAYVFTGNVYGAIAAVGLAAAVRSRVDGSDVSFDRDTARDVGKLLLGFALLWLYLYWSQFLTIWYGNVPREFDFLVARVNGPWRGSAWSVFVLCFGLPFIVLLARSGRRPLPVLIAAGLCLAGLWLERLVLVAGGHDLGSAVAWTGAAVTLAFGALFVLSQMLPLMSLPSPASRAGRH